MAPVNCCIKYVPQVGLSFDYRVCVENFSMFATSVIAVLDVPISWRIYKSILTSAWN